MGVQGLWEIVNKAGQPRSLANLATTEGFERNNSGVRAFRIGIDASLWFHHAQFSKGGENPELRLLFFRLCALAELPILPLFIFDGRNRPKVKRGSRMGKSGSHPLTEGMKKLLDIFGMQWRVAFGEAEAELAHLNRTGIIDAVMTDDVDALVFGALRVIKNQSPSLSGNKANPALNADGKATKNHVMIYTAAAIWQHPDIQMNRGGFILFALLVKGDYSEGVIDIGKQTAHALSRCGFGDELLAIFYRRDDEDIRPALSRWRTAVNTELNTNSRGFLRQAYPSLTLPKDFPDMKLLEKYANPVCSAKFGRQGGGPIHDSGELNLARTAAFCEEHFGEWGYRSAIIKRFRNVLWKAATMRVLRRATLEADDKERKKRLDQGNGPAIIKGLLSPSSKDAIGTPSSLIDKYFGTHCHRDRAAIATSDPSAHRNLVTQIFSSRNHSSTDGMLEYRIEIFPSQLVQITSMGISGIRPEPSLAPEDDPSPSLHPTPKNAPPDPHSPLRLWVPSAIIREVHPDLVAKFEDNLVVKAQARQTKRKKGDESGKTSKSTSQPSPVTPNSRQSPDPIRTLPERDLLPSDATSQSCDPPSGHFLFSMPNPDESSYSESASDNSDCEFPPTPHAKDVVVVDSTRGRSDSDVQCKSSKRQKTGHAFGGPCQPTTQTIDDAEIIELISDSDDDIFPSHLSSLLKRPSAGGQYTHVQCGQAPSSGPGTYRDIIDLTL